MQVSTPLLQQAKPPKLHRRMGNQSWVDELHTFYSRCSGCCISILRCIATPHEILAAKVNKVVGHLSDFRGG